MLLALTSMVGTADNYASTTRSSSWSSVSPYRETFLSHLLRHNDTMHCKPHIDQICNDNNPGNSNFTPTSASYVRPKVFQCSLWAIARHIFCNIGPLNLAIGPDANLDDPSTRKYDGYDKSGLWGHMGAYVESKGNSALKDREEGHRAVVEDYGSMGGLVGF